MSTRVSETDLDLLARLWLAEPDAELIAALRRTPGLAEHVPSCGDGDDVVRLDLAVAWLDLVSRHVAPHESVFVDPTAMLDAPSTARWRATLARAGWSPPSGLRVPADDHLGVQLLALSGLGDRGTAVLTDHLLVWLPLFADAIAHADVHPLYAAAARATVDVVLARGDQLPPTALSSTANDIVPALPPRPRYRANETGDGVPSWPSDDDVGGAPLEDPSPTTGDARLRDILDALLYPRDAGLFLSRTDIARCAAALDLPVGLGDRRWMLRGLFEAAGRHDAVARLLDTLDVRWATASAAYGRWASEHPCWRVYGAAWQSRLTATRTAMAVWRQAAESPM